MEVSRIFVVGAGLMGSGIAQVAAQAGYEVILEDVSKEALSRGLENIRDSLARLERKGKITAEQASQALARLGTAEGLEKASEADFVIEAVYEDLDLKIRVFRELDAICLPRTVLATNTSALSITKIASATRRPDRVVGMHFFSPVPLMPVVEVIRGLNTSDATFALAEQVGKRMGKTVVKVQKDFGGFLVNRIYLPYMRMAIIALTEGLGSVEDIDQAIRLALGYPMGPFELTDMVGADVLLMAMEAIYRDVGDESYSPPPLLRRMVEAGLLGRKTGRGFYEYDAQGNRLGPSLS